MANDVHDHIKTCERTSKRTNGRVGGLSVGRASEQASEKKHTFIQTHTHTFCLHYIVWRIWCDAVAKRIAFVGHCSHCRCFCCCCWRFWLITLTANNTMKTCFDLRSYTHLFLILFSLSLPCGCLFPVCFAQSVYKYVCAFVFMPIHIVSICLLTFFSVYMFLLALIIMGQNETHHYVSNQDQEFPPSFKFMRFNSLTVFLLLFHPHSGVKRTHTHVLAHIRTKIELTQMKQKIISESCSQRK